MSIIGLSTTTSINIRSFNATKLNQTAFKTSIIKVSFALQFAERKFWLQYFLNTKLIKSEPH